jgi:hypothetical protein
VADPNQLKHLRQGVEGWNKWRQEHPEEPVDLSGALLDGINLQGASLWMANLEGAECWKINLTEANLEKANLRGAQLEGADLKDVNLREAFLRDASLDGAKLWRVNLQGADLSGASLRGAQLTDVNLEHSILVKANLEEAVLADCTVYGASVWDVRLDGAKQARLVITPWGTAEITVDDLEVAQFIYLLLNNESVRRVIDTVTSKVVLILGRFTDERKAVLDALRDKLRTRNLTPVLFDFSKPARKDATGTVETLARMARFIVADLTDPSSIPHELATVVPFLRTTPVVLLRLAGTAGYSLVKDLEAYDRWVLPVREYPDSAALINNLDDFVILPAEAKLGVLRPDTPAG